ncbi:M15 family metallopeptidase [Pleionea sp. CnH1-48]|uniref:M15 family metallopeptidase n=1 Tax=Pleionea sp. CnH1-48 TaxID=2954494 RepID=UPI002096B9F8|nr:M15 family metallopeptidase [Pleionea sp. CnH1-48]MCO7225635.1 M15 family metallopeptidase [Pleionea sp. CnH1-48]
MKKVTMLWVGWMVVCYSSVMNAKELPDGFSDIEAEIPGAMIELRYITNHNFVGNKVDGYLTARGILSSKAVAALKNVQKDLRRFDLGIKVFDAYRPQRAVDHFVRWAKDLSDQKTKSIYYPDVEKSQLFALDYIASRSGHTRGSTLDLTLISLSSGDELDMGSGFDFFGKESWPEHKELTLQQRANRMLLQTVMVKHGFLPYPKEWWHFTLSNEPYPETYFDFAIE